MKHLWSTGCADKTSSYLIGRTELVTSVEIQFISEVLQALILGSLFFILFINDVMRNDVSLNPDSECLSFIC
jgi:hypothetical protein